MKRLEHNVETNKVIEIELTAEEIEAYKLSAKETEEKIKSENKKLEDENQARLLILDKLGITEDEAKLLLS